MPRFHAAPNTVAFRLRALREGRDLTIPECAAALGVSARTYHGWELGRRPGAAAGPLDRLLGLIERRPELWGEIVKWGDEK